ncbi:MAG: alpha/beta hydrolase domain-containing protein [Actinomycetes bacterium]
MKRSLKLKLGIVGLLLVAVSCSGGESSTDTSTGPSDSTVSTETPSTDAPVEPGFTAVTPTTGTVGEVTVEGPITVSNRVPLPDFLAGVPTASVVLAGVPFEAEKFGYIEEEFFISGTANSYGSADPLSADGVWNVTKNDTAEFKTRIVVRRPSDPAKFNGTVITEWFNVTAGIDSIPAWSALWPEIVREGSAWVGVSAQRVGIEGGAGSTAPFLVLKNADPDRYGGLNHPGDNYSYDIFSQAGAALWRQSKTILGGLTPEILLATGQSQSASRLTTYANAFGLADDVYNGYLLISRGQSASTLFCPNAVLLENPRSCLDPATTETVAGPVSAQIRADLVRPVLIAEAETDVLRYRPATQDDTDVLRIWESAGTSHSDAYTLGIGDADTATGDGDIALFKAQLAAPSSVYYGIITCGLPLNAGPHTYILRSALHGLDHWVRSGEAPTSMPKLEANADLSAYLMDANGNVLGGIRTPFVDVPLAKLSGSGQEGDAFCGLFGTTLGFTPDELKVLYPTTQDFVAKWNAATDAAVATGALLAVDAENIKAAAKNFIIK